MNPLFSDQPLNLTGCFIAAMPTLDDPIFSRSLAYVCSHGEQGACALIINKPLAIDISFLCQKPSNDPSYSNQTIYFGGPIQQDKGFVIHRKTDQKWESTLDINDELSLTSSKDIILSIVENKGPEEFLIASGYSGWEKGGLEEEIMNNYWIVTPGNPSLLFDAPPNQRLYYAIRSVGIRFGDLSPLAGHA